MKKFFKILMVLALLSGAALSCTKDYSKEIADVQKQNQDLQALVASLQNALNSTNATVSQLSSTSDKQAADIAALASANAEAFATIVADHADDVAYLEGLITDLKAAGASELAAAVEGLKASIKAGDDKAAAAAEKLESEIKACDEKAAKALADAVTTCKEDIAKLKEALEGKITDLETALTAALEAKAGALAEEIEKVDGKATANAAAIVEIDKTLEGIAATLEAYGKDIQKNADAIEANKTAIAAAQADLAKIKEQITSLSARLTNIVAAPAKNAEIQGIIFGEHKRSIINMNFVVAPASAAEAIAAGNADVKLVLTNGISRKNESKPAVLNYTVTPDKVTAGENGIINVYAVEDTIFDVAKYGYNEKIYATLIVSGTDEAGDFERISDPVAAIDGGVDSIEENNFEWYKGDKAVPTVDSFSLWNVDHTVDSVAAYGMTLYYIAADKDWTTLPCTESDILKDYVLKTKIGDTALSIYEVADLFEIDREKVKPHFIPENKTTIALESICTVGEWRDGFADTEEIARKAITITPDSTSTKFDVKLELPEENRENAVGSYRYVMTTPIAFGELSTYARVRFAQRIGKHVEEEKAAEPLNIKFGVDNLINSAAQALVVFESVKWLSTTQIRYDWDDKNAKVFALNEDGGLGKELEGPYYGLIASDYYKPKFVNVEVFVPYAKETQQLRLVLENDAQKNDYGVVILEHGDYIDLTVEPYHKSVDRTTTVEDFYLSRKTDVATIKTDITVKNLFSDINDWLIEDAKTDDDSNKVYNWFKDHNFKDAEYTVNQDKKDVGNANIFIKPFTDTIFVEFTKNDKLVEGKPVTISVKDSIDDVIKFNYTVSFTPIKPEVSVATIPGFVKDGQIIEVAGKLVNGKYAIEDINLSQYFKFANVDKKHENDEISVKFSDDTTGLEYSAADSTYKVANGTKDVLDAAAKISWGTLKATSFVLTAQAQLEGAKVGDAVTVTVVTADPIKTIDKVTIEKELKGAAATIDLFKDLKIFSILDTKNSIYPNGLEAYGGTEPKVAPMKDWTCTVNGVDYPNAQMQQLFTGIDGSKLSVKEHDAIGTIAITIPCEFEYDFGKKEFDVILTIK